MMKLLLLFFGQMVNFVIATFGYRAASHGRLWLTGGADFLFCMVNFLLIRQIAEAKNTYELLAYATGGAIGSMIAIRLTQHWKH